MKFLWLEIQYKINSLDVWSLSVENEALLTCNFAQFSIKTSLFVQIDQGILCCSLIIIRDFKRLESVYSTYFPPRNDDVQPRLSIM